MIEVSLIRLYLIFLNINGNLRLLVITSFIFNEMLSILENSSEMGIKVPKFLYQSLEKLHQNKEENSEK